MVRVGNYPGEFLRIKDEVDPGSNPRRLLFELDKVGRSPGRCVRGRIKGTRCRWSPTWPASRKLWRKARRQTRGPSDCDPRSLPELTFLAKTVSVARWDDVRDRKRRYDLFKLRFSAANSPVDAGAYNHAGSSSRAIPSPASTPPASTV
jgi:hypothetical protein